LCKFTVIRTITKTAESSLHNGWCYAGWCQWSVVLLAPLSHYWHSWVNLSDVKRLSFFVDIKKCNYTVEGLEGPNMKKTGLPTENIWHSGVIDTAGSTSNSNVLANSKLCAKTL
jgi:hypothetical protein